MIIDGPTKVDLNIHNIRLVQVYFHSTLLIRGFVLTNSPLELWGQDRRQSAFSAGKINAVRLAIQIRKRLQYPCPSTLSLLLSPASILARRGRRVVSLDKRRGSIPLSLRHCQVFKAASIPGVQYHFLTGSRLFGFILRVHLLCASFLRLGAIKQFDIMYLGMNPWLGLHED